MCKHDFIQTNSDNFTLTIPVAGYSIYKFYYELKGEENYVWDTYILVLMVFVSFTNEFHKVYFVLMLGVLTYV